MNMKNIMLVMGGMALMGAGMYVMYECPKAKKKVGKAILDKMDCAEEMIAKKMK